MNKESIVSSTCTEHTPPSSAPPPDILIENTMQTREQWHEQERNGDMHLNWKVLLLGWTMLRWVLLGWHLTLTREGLCIVLWLAGWLDVMSHHHMNRGIFQVACINYVPFSFHEEHHHRRDTTHHHSLSVAVPVCLSAKLWWLELYVSPHQDLTIGKACTRMWLLISTLNNSSSCVVRWWMWNCM